MSVPADSMALLNAILHFGLIRMRSMLESSWYSRLLSTQKQLTLVEFLHQIPPLLADPTPDGFRWFLDSGVRDFISHIENSGIKSDDVHLVQLCLEFYELEKSRSTVCWVFPEGIRERLRND